MNNNQMKKEKISILNVKVYCEYVLNEKPPIVLIHGFLSSTYTFNRLVPLLIKHFSVVSLDLPGFGRSEKCDSFHYSFTSYAQLIISCMDYFGINKAILCGHSMGGQVVLNIARIAPEKVARLVLLCSSGYMKRASRLLIYISYLPFFQQFLSRYIQKKGAKHGLETALYDRSLITEEMINEYKRPLAEKAFYNSLIRLARHREGDLSSDNLKTINKPVLLIWGEEDRVVPLEVGKRLVGDLPNAKLITFKKAGHLITEEKPEDILTQFCSFAQ
jgi:pimeloyl-ACP methyl ester carboxylesterase